MTKTNLMLLREHERKAPIETLLRDYFAQGLTDQEIADELEISRQSLLNWLELLGASVSRSRIVTFSEEANAVAV